jgi:hypothetical protein
MEYKVFTEHSLRNLNHSVSTAIISMGWNLAGGVAMTETYLSDDDKVHTDDDEKPVILFAQAVYK